MRCYRLPFAALWASVVALLCISCTSALALDEFQKLLANDAGIGDSLGRSVGLSGDTAIVGAFHDDHSSLIDAGSAYVYRDDGLGTWNQLDKLIADDAVAEDLFGISVAISGNTAIVGAAPEGGQGAAYIFADDGAGDWMQIDKLQAAGGAGDEFGYSVDIDGNTAIVGAWKRDIGPELEEAGEAYIFRDDGLGNWNPIATLTAEGDVAASAHFGISVSISGSTALVGASLDSESAGAAYVFREGSVSGWDRVDRLMPDDAALGQQFGSAVALEGDRAVIGAIGDATGAVGAGAAYVFELDGSMVWQQVDKLLASDPVHDGRLGFAVDLSGNTVVAGGSQQDVAGVKTGAAYYFRDNGEGAWNQIAKLIASDGEAGDALGYSTAIDGDVAVVGAAFSNDGTDSGSAYLYDVPGPILVGDKNHDRKVGPGDYTVYRNSLGQMGDGLNADGNGDGIVNDADYKLWKRNYGLTMATGAAVLPVPEPAASTLLLLAGLLAMLRRSRR